MVVKPFGGNAADVNQPLNAAQAAEFLTAGITGIFRYIPRTPSLIAGTLTATEMTILLNAGLAICCVQHVALSGWMPTEALGQNYADYAVTYLSAIGYPKGANVFLDLEGVANGATADDVNLYCRAWMGVLSAAGWPPGLYCGWQTGLSDAQLYDLPTTVYWCAYNGDQTIPERGYAIKQHTQQTLGSLTYDPDTIAPDAKGGLPIFVFNS